jgi:hypothetical protein
MKTAEEIIKPYEDRIFVINKDIAVDDRISPDLYLFMKWAHRVRKGWYGFALGKEVPLVWAKIIEDFLDELVKEAPNFQICQIKLKFGGLRFYVDLNLEDEEKVKVINEEIVKLCAILFDKRLIY